MTGDFAVLNWNGINNFVMRHMKLWWYFCISGEHAPWFANFWCRINIEMDLFDYPWKKEVYIWVGDSTYISLKLIMTDNKGVIWGAKCASHCGIRSISCFCMDWYDTHLGKGLPFGDGAELRMSAWWNRRLSGTISSEHPSSPGICNRSSLYKERPPCDRPLKDMNTVVILFRFMREIS